jgi:RND family efflux transporter MFP subunit
MIATADSVMLEDGPAIAGNLVAQREAQLRAQVSGPVVTLRVREGEAVQAGQLLAVIDTTVLADQLRSARLAVTSAEVTAATAARNRDRSERLLAAGAVAPRDAENAVDVVTQTVALLQDARARAAAAEQQLEHARVRAPFAGVVSQLSVSVGDVVSAGAATPIAVVVDPRVLELEGTVPAARLAEVVVGAPVEFAVAAAPGVRIRGTVLRINPAIDPATGQVRLYVRIPNDAGTLAVGLFAQGRVAVARRRVLTVPLSAIDPRATAPAVRRVRHDTVEIVPVGLGLQDDVVERVEVTSGLTAGDTVLVGGALGTPAGTAVRVARGDG